MAPTVLTLANGDVLLAERATEQTVALARLSKDAGLERWHAAALADPRRRCRDDLAVYLRELIVVLAAEIEARSDAYRLGVEAEHYLATR